MDKHLSRLAILSSLALPFSALAQDLGSIIDIVGELLDAVIPVLMVLATVVFLYGVVTYLTAAGDEEKSKTGKIYIIWGIIALFAMLTIWGLVNVLVNTFKISGSGIPMAPL